MRLGRVAAITGSIAAVGAVIGGALGAALLSLWSLRLTGYVAIMRDVALAGAGTGAALGAVLAPITAWVFLRRIPLGRALAQTAVGTTLGAAVGLVAGAIGGDRMAVMSLPIGLVGALAGFLGASLRLRFRSRTALPAGERTSVKAGTGR